MYKKLFLFVAIITLLTLAACGNGDTDASGEASASETIRVGFQKGNSLHILKTTGYLDEALQEQGISVEWRELATGGALLEALNAGSIDFGHAADANAVFSQAAGMPLVYVAAALPNPEGLGIIVHGDAEFETVADLAGERVAIGQGWNSHYLLLKALQEVGLSEEDINFAYVSDASEGRAAFESGEVSALGFWDPFLAALELDIDARILLDGEGFTNNRTYYFASEDFANENSELVSTILTELARSDEWANENKDELADVLAAELGIELDPVQRQVNRKTYGVEKIDSNITAEQQDIADVFFQEGLIDEEITVADMVTEDPEWIPEDWN
ncbi:MULTISPECIES: aliphatic sulfonate ABC transporter substrate-binding protein [Bacillaceae]|uniref:Aliphatic sulfonate ABC transporter substrate-binding protein n=1 Tax=Evansella alkalicola TaxID=745819 RepID=A0ABS6JYF8_9BACI|nr:MULTISPECIES: aliphatic sulfonate ABC transporter substrate-binding protein [Bacillaceae]MBU9723262.1 aliphatic sulfonate ABC transporter substrate-binding protein [Bacillus alkalicola]